MKNLLTIIVLAFFMQKTTAQHIPEKQRETTMLYYKIQAQRDEALKKENFDDALKQAQQLAVTPHWERCGNGASSREHRNTMIQMDCLDKLNRPKDLMPLVLQMAIENDDFNGTHNNPNGEPDFLPYLRKAIATQKNAKQNLIDFEKIIAYTISHDYTTGFSLFGVPIQMDLYKFTWLENKGTFEDYFKQELKKTILYKAIVEEFDYTKPVRYFLKYKQSEKFYSLEANDTLAKISESRLDNVREKEIVLNATDRKLLLQKLEKHYKLNYDFDAAAKPPIDKTKMMYVTLQTRQTVGLNLFNDFFQTIFTEFSKPNIDK